MAIRLADNHELEIDQLMAQTLAFAIQHQSRHVESDFWNIGGLKVQCVVVRKPVRKKLTYVRYLHADGWRMSKNALLWKLRHGD
jgi:hypothetical protein